MHSRNWRDQINSKNAKQIANCTSLAHLYHTIRSTLIPHDTQHIYTTRYTAHLYHTIHSTLIPHNTQHTYTTRYAAHLYHTIRSTLIPHDTQHTYTTRYAAHLYHTIRGTLIPHDTQHTNTTRYTAQQRITKYVSCFGFALLTFAFTEIGYPLEFLMAYSEFQLLKLYYDTPDRFPCQYRLPPYPLVS